jgi:hypothetical protein
MLIACCRPTIRPCMALPDLHYQQQACQFRCAPPSLRIYMWGQPAVSS